MCGLVASVCIARGAGPVDPATFAVMTDTLAHRGPDARGVHAWRDGRVAFGHRRLSIVDVHPEADQPFLDETGAVGVIFNGEIYNHVDIRRDLEAEGVRFRTRNSDTEVLLRGFMAWGMERLLARVSGMYAFLIWDDREGALYAARDHMGIKPLYYADVDGRLIVSSEIRAISQTPGFRPRLNQRALLATVNVLASPPPETVFDGVFKLGPGMHLRWSAADGFAKRAFWAPPHASAPAPADPVSATRAVFDRAVALRLPDEVQTAIFLSGGLDSALILESAVRQGLRPQALTIGFGDNPLDESEAAAATAAHFGVPHEVVRVTSEEAMNFIPRLAESQDEPVVDWACLPLHYLSARAREAGAKVALVGEGADETFAGYDAWQDFIHERLFWRAVEAGGPASFGALSAACQALAGRLPARRFGGIGWLDVAASVAGGRGRFRSGAESLRPSQVARLMKPDWTPDASIPDIGGGAAPERDIDARLAELGGVVRGGSGARFAAMRRRDLRFRLPELLLMRVDKVTMRSSLEARVPFLDRTLLETVLSWPPETVLMDGGTKPVLRAAAKGYLPDEVITRPKVGLGAPAASWLRGPVGAEMRDASIAFAERHDSPFSPAAIAAMFDRHRRGERDYAPYLWPIANLSLWATRWVS